MATPNGITTYQETLLREDLSDQIADVSPDANPLYTTLGRTKATQRTHEWGEYYISRSTSEAGTIEGDDASFSDLDTATRRANKTGIVRKTFAVTDSEIEADKVSPKDAYAREMGYGMRKWKNSAEWALLRASMASGSSGVARMMQGIREWVNQYGLSSNGMSGVSLSEALFNGLELESWNTTDEYVFDMVLVTGTLKQRISGFTAGNTKNIAAQDQRLVNSIDVYEGDFGMHEIRAHKDMLAKDILGIRKELLKVAEFRAPKHTELARTGAARKGMIEGEFTLEVKSARPMVLRYNVL